MNNKIIIINGPNLNLLGEREQSQYGTITFDGLKEKCLKKATELKIDVEFFQSNIEGEIVSKIQEARKDFDGIIINAAGFTHTSVAIRDALEVFKKPIIELHISNIYKREEFRHKSLISNVVTGGIFGLGSDGEAANNLDRIDLVNQLCQHRRLISGSCTEFQNSRRFIHLQKVGHQRDNKRLGNCLIISNRQRITPISAVTKGLGYELVTFNFANRGKHLL